MEHVLTLCNVTFDLFCGLSKPATVREGWCNAFYTDLQSYQGYACVTRCRKQALWRSLRERVGNDLGHVLREALVRCHALQLSHHERLPALVHLFVRRERRDHARCNRGVDAIDPEDKVRHELVARPVFGMEVDGAGGKREEERVAVVGVGDVEGLMVHKLLHLDEVACLVAGRLQNETFVLVDARPLEPTSSLSH